MSAYMLPRSSSVRLLRLAARLAIADNSVLQLPLVLTLTPKHLRVMWTDRYVCGWVHLPWEGPSRSRTVRVDLAAAHRLLRAVRAGGGPQLEVEVTRRGVRFDDVCVPFAYPYKGHDGKPLPFWDEKVKEWDQLEPEDRPIAAAPHVFKRLVEWASANTHATVEFTQVGPIARVGDGETWGAWMSLARRWDR